jgi:hypothetical protein
MSTIQLVHITLEIWGAVFCLIIGDSDIRGKTDRT